MTGTLALSKLETSFRGLLLLRLGWFKDPVVNPNPKPNTPNRTLCLSSQGKTHAQNLFSHFSLSKVSAIGVNTLIWKEETDVVK